MRRAWLGFLALALGLATGAQAQTSGYNYVKLWNLPPDAYLTNVILNDDGDVAVLQSDFARTQRLYFVPRGAGFNLIASADTTFGPMAELRLRGLSRSETVLYGVDFFPTEPTSRAIRSWNRSSLPTQIAAIFYEDVDNLDPLPDQSPTGEVSYWQSIDLGEVLVFRYGSAGFENLGTCGSVSRTAIAANGTVFADCAASSVAASRPIYRFEPGNVSVFVNEASFGSTVDERFTALSARESGTLLFTRWDAYPDGYYTTTGSGAPAFFSGFDYTGIERNAIGQMLLVPLFSSAIYVLPAAEPFVVGAQTQIGGATVSFVLDQASLNDRGQVAFVAGLSDGTLGVFLASPQSCDADQDGWCNSQDNCRTRANQSQLDSDGDGLGDYCDNCPFHANPDQVDSGGDARGDACPPCSENTEVLPICGTRVVGAGSSSFALPPVPLWTHLPRPGLRALAIPSTPGLAVDVALSGCTGGQPTPFWGPLVAPANGDGVFLARVIDTYTQAFDRAGAYCPVTFTSAGVAGSFDYLVEMTTLQPVAGLSTATGSSATASTPGSVPYLEEAHNYRFLFSGTGGSNFGTCTFDPDVVSVPYLDDRAVVYSTATGPGWDCCTFQYDGVDGLPSSVGQIVFNLNGPLPPPDPDGDGFLSPCDSCDYVSNVDQRDRGAIASTTPDGVGDACQCGELTADGIVNASDAARLRQHLAGSGAPLGSDELARCSVIGGQTECTVRTLSVLRRTLVGLAPGAQQVCDRAVP